MRLWSVELRHYAIISIGHLLLGDRESLFKTLSLPFIPLGFGIAIIVFQDFLAIEMVEPDMVETSPVMAQKVQSPLLRLFDGKDGK
jgi:hypothetical protein